jgi:hypothetical protein
VSGPSGFAAIPAHLFGALDPYELAVFAVLAIHQNDNHECWPSHARIADMSGCSERKVRDVLVDLRDKGVIEWQARGRDDGGKTSNLYRLIGMVPGTVRPTPRQDTPNPPAQDAEEPTHRTNPGNHEAVPSGPAQAPPTRSGPATRDAGALIGAWAKGVQTTGRAPHASQRTRFAKAARTYAENADLAALPPEQWLRAVDTAYVLGTQVEFHLLDAFLGGGGRPPRLPASCRYRIGSRGGISESARLNIDQPLATWETA